MNKRRLIKKRILIKTIVFMVLIMVAALMCFGGVCNNKFKVSLIGLLLVFSLALAEICMSFIEYDNDL